MMNEEDKFYIVKGKGKVMNERKNNERGGEIINEEGKNELKGEMMEEERK